MILNDVLPKEDETGSVGTQERKFANIVTKNVILTGSITSNGNTYTTDPDTEVLKGISLDSSENLTLNVGSNLKTGENFINNDGTDSKGLSFNSTGDATFNQKVISTGNIEAGSNIDLGANFINDTGASSRGLKFVTSPSVSGRFFNDLIVDGDGTIDGDLSGNTIQSGSYVQQSIARIRYMTAQVDVATVADYVLLYTSGGDLKAKFPNGKIVTLATDD